MTAAVAVAGGIGPVTAGGGGGNFAGGRAVAHQLTKRTLG